MLYADQTPRRQGPPPHQPESGWRSSRRSGAISRMPSTWVTASWSAIPGKEMASASDRRRRPLCRPETQDDQSADRARDLDLRSIPGSPRRCGRGGKSWRSTPCCSSANTAITPAMTRGRSYIHVTSFSRNTQGFRTRAVGPVFNDKHLSFSFAQGEGDGRDVEAARISVSGRFVIAGHMAAATDRAPVVA